MNRLLVGFGGVALAMAATALWHDLGAGDRMANTIERNARLQLDHDEMTQVQARVQRGPMSRELMLSGPADDFQRREIVARMEQLPGVGGARWETSSLPVEQRR
jgi:hypothetical protein